MSESPERVPRVSTGNRCRLLPSGDHSFQALLDAIDGARERVWIETYIFQPDAAGQQVLRALEGAARRGCDVVLMIDRFGSKALKDRHVEGLRAAGGWAFWYNPLLALKPYSNKVTPLGVHRDHRKIFLVDRGPVFCGGRNVSMKFGGPGPEAFFDMMMRVDGPAVRDLAAVFLETLDDTTDLDRTLFDPPPPAGDLTLRVLQLDLRERVGELDHALCELIAGAEREVLYSSPYFIPPGPILEELLATARRGVDVRVLTAGKTDVPPVRWAGRRLYRRLLDAGVRLWEMQGVILHAKYFVADGRCSIVGSYNADRWGQRYNQEVAVLVEGAAVARGLAEHFAEAVGRSVRVTEETVAGWPAWRRAGYAAAHALSHVVAPDASRVRRLPDPSLERLTHGGSTSPEHP